MAGNAPLFPTTVSLHYSDYGFDPQIAYFQVLEEPRRHGKKNEWSRSMDALHFKLQKPISKDDRSKSKKRRQWWKNAFGRLWKRGRGGGGDVGAFDVSSPMEVSYSASPWCRATSGPLYGSEIAREGNSAFRASRPSVGPLRVAEMGEAGLLPYISLRDLNLAEEYFNEFDSGRRETIRNQAGIGVALIVAEGGRT
ncbi:hypothetical protein HPP92_011569 [Vanilla planifolia]|uniref:Uncharacterized protein n=1 Tax=Vanilla planifolia TaxID=51239 RepID=A0A835R122_VANPL|nr:hypothetical protein HPP92_011860 [Vanilla planifolia]KAG0483485.1 hypothetical protein HPP92_011569 [Vanilla planifolia]